MLIFVLLVIISPVKGMNYSNSVEEYKVNGTPYHVYNDEEDGFLTYNSISDFCKYDTALKFFGCDDFILTNSFDHNINDVTVLVIDDPLSVEIWQEGEDSGWYDIVEYVLIDPAYIMESDPTHPDSGVKFKSGDIGQEDFSQLDDQELGFRNDDHGGRVLSSLAMVTGFIKVVYVSYTTPMNGDTVGAMWEWINTNRFENGGINIITTSLAWNENHNAYSEHFSTWIDEGRILLAAAGNEWTSTPTHPYPSFYPEWMSIGSIDHEMRYNEDFGWTSYAFLFTGAYTGTSFTFEGITADYYPVFGSNWDPNANDFVMPGNGVPTRIYSFSSPEWVYTTGTSYSTPYLAGVIAVVIDNYMDGRAKDGGSRTPPSYAMVYSLLMDASSLNLLHLMEGWGYVSLSSAAMFALIAGDASYNPPPPPPPPPPGGGGCGPNPCLEP